MSTLGFALVLVISALVGAPFLATATARWWPQLPARRRSVALGVAAGIVACVVAAVVLRVSLWNYEADLFCLALAYLSCALIAGAAFRSRERATGVAIGTLLGLPLVVGLVVGTVAIGVLIFAIADTIPNYVGQVGRDIKCYVTSNGEHWTPTGTYDIVVNRQLPILRFIEVTIAREHLVYPRMIPADACAKVAAAHGG